MADEARAGSTVEYHALVLGVVPLRESDRLVNLLSLEHGRFSAVARGAARSRNRFGASLEPLNYIKAHLRVPRGSQEASLWQLERADLKDSFAHLRQSYAGLESAFFVLRLVRDLIPEGAVDVSLFKAVGRFLRDSAVAELSRNASWARLSFWTWFTHHLGFGDLSAPFEPQLLAVHGEGLRLWHESLASAEPQFERLFRFLSAHPPAPLGPRDESAVYARWLELSGGMHWDHFEEWMSQRSVSVSPSPSPSSASPR